MLSVELKCRSEALRATFVNFRKARLNEKAFEAFRVNHVEYVLPDVMRSVKVNFFCISVATGNVNHFLL